jgi:metallo-beta-lactamase family protein
VLPGLRARLAPSGHMVGSCFVHLDDGKRSVLFSGDIGRPHDLVLRPPVTMEGADYLVVESTYGDRSHPVTDPLKALGEVIRRTVARLGVVVIPAFAVGRAQSLLHCIQELKRRGVVRHDLPVFLNSPMAAGATAVYLRHASELRLTAAQCDALRDAAQVVETPEESRLLNTRRGPMVIVAASGMATGGRVVHHLKAFAPDPRNTILFSGYQAGGTRGARIASGAATVRIFGEEVPVRAEVASLEDLSAHADASEIMGWMRGFARPPRRVFINHGEPAAADALRLRIERELHWDCHLPYYLEQLTLE